MKRIYLIGLLGAAAAAVLGVILVLAFLVVPVRAQIGQAVNLALQGSPRAAIQVLTQQLKSEKGVLVAGVMQDSPADKAGIVRGDILINVDGQEINTTSELKTILAGHKAGDAIKVVVQHGDTQKTVTVTLADAPAQAQATGTPESGQQNNGQTQPEPSLQRGPYLGILPLGAGEWKGGVGKPGFRHAGGMIMEVVAGSPAEKAGLKVGEVIETVDGQQLGQQLDLSTAISSHKPGDSVKLVVLDTSGTKREVTVILGENPDKPGSAWLGVSVGGARFRLDGAVPGQPGSPGQPSSPDQLPFHRGLVPGLIGHPGALIGEVAQDGPAEKAGLKAGQLIVSIDGKKVDSAQTLTDIVSSHKPGDAVTLSVYDPQAAKSSDVKVTLGENPEKAGSAYLGISFMFIQMQPKAPTTGSQF